MFVNIAESEVPAKDEVREYKVIMDDIPMMLLLFFIEIFTGPYLDHLLIFSMPDLTFHFWSL